MRAKVIDWDGRNVPEEMRELPPGRYIVEPFADPAPLSSEEEDGILAALDELDAGGGMSLADVVREIRGNTSGR